MSDHGNNLDPVVKTRRVPLPPDQAFTLFSADMGSWWPLASHSVSGSADARVSFGVRAGGTVDEHAPDGTTHVWAEVLAAEPADRVVLTWHPGAEANPASQVSVRFEPDGARFASLDIIYDTHPVRAEHGDKYESLAGGT